MMKLGTVASITARAQIFVQDWVNSKTVRPRTLALGITAFVTPELALSVDCALVVHYTTSQSVGE